MTEIHAIPAPRALHDATLGNARNFITSANGRFIATWCSRNLVGGIFNTDAGAWAIFSPILLEKFINILVVGNLFDRNSPRFIAWERSLRAPKTGRPRMH